MKIHVPADVLEVLEVLHSRDYEAYLVGGAVRDLILGKQPSDWDIATNATPMDIIWIFQRAGWWVVPKGLKYGVIQVIHPKTRRRVEITTFRKETYTEKWNRKSLVVTFGKTLEDDVIRRDFTINALAIDKDGNIIDLVGGLKDLENRIIRFIGQPSRRVTDDPLRMIRALRFVAQLGFTLDESAFNAIKQNAEAIKIISKERIGYEFIKASKGPFFHKFIDLLYKTTLYKYIIPELDAMAKVRHDNRGYHNGETVLEHTLTALERADKVNLDWRVKIAVLMHDMGKPNTMRIEGDKITFYNHEKISYAMSQDIILRRLRLPSSVARVVGRIVLYHMRVLSYNLDELGAKIINKMIGKYWDLTPLLLQHAYADTGDKRYLALAEQANKFLNREPPIITGYEIMKIWGIKPGPEIAKIKQKLYEVQLQYNIKSKDDLVKKAVQLGVVPPPKDSQQHHSISQNS